MKLPLLSIAMLALSLVACSERSSVTSGGGEAQGDGGKSSAKFAGTYRGQAVFQYFGGGLDGQSDLNTIVVVVGTNGTVSTTIEDTTVSGVIDDNQVEINLKIDRSQNGISCDATVLLKGTISGRRMSGPISGKGDCSVYGIPKKITLGGSFAATKI